VKTLRVSDALQGVAASGWSSDHMSYFSSYRHNGWLRQRFNDDRIVVADLAKTSLSTASRDSVHLYAYFRLTNSS
jgi:hypothetical protein